MRFAKLYWILPLIFLIGLFCLLFILKDNGVKCGDGRCDSTEISFCKMDCKEECMINEVIATGGDEMKECSKGWQSTYYDILLERNLSTDYLKETNDIDYSNSVIKTIASQLKRDTPKETAKATAKWTYNNLRYDSLNTYNDCVDAKASDIILRGYGICSTQSKVNLALLRANGIPSRIVTGCFTYSGFCKNIQTFFRIPVPTVFPVEVDNSGYVSTRGGLHAFVEILIPEEKEWVILESTIGLLYANNCVNYRTYYTSENDMTPDSPKVCGLAANNPYVNDCKEWI